MDPTTTAPSTTEPSPGKALPAWHPLSDHLRWVKAGALAALLVAMGAYLGWVTERDTTYVHEMLENPERYHGDEVYLGNFAVLAIEGGGAELASPWVQVSASPVPAEVKVGDAVSVLGHFQRDGSVRVDRWDVLELLWLKKLVGITATLGTAVGISVVWWRRVRRRRA